MDVSRGKILSILAFYRLTSSSAPPLIRFDLLQTASNEATSICCQRPRTASA
jgi:hypothetical protein